MRDFAGRIACFLGRHQEAIESRRLGFVRITLCTRPHCSRYAITKGWR